MAAASSGPYLRSVAARRHHVVAVFSVAPDVAPTQIVVAVSPKTQRNGEFVAANVRLREGIGTTTKVKGGRRVVTRHTLRAGRYWVEISGMPIGVDCLPGKPCRLDWSNVRRVVIPR